MGRQTHRQTCQVDTASVQLVADQVYGLPCCVPKGSCLKMQKIWPSAAAMLADEGLMGSLRNLCRNLVLTDMVSERLLARYRQACGGDMKKVDIERVCSAGLLPLFRREHTHVALPGHEAAPCARGARGAACGCRPTCGRGRQQHFAHVLAARVVHAAQLRLGDAFLAVACGEAVRACACPCLWPLP